VSRSEPGRNASLNALCRTDRIWALLRDFRERYRGNLSVVELGTSDGYSFGKVLHVARHLGMEDRLTVHAFDSFEGGPSAAAGSESGVVDLRARGERRIRYEHLRNYCAARYRNFRVHQGNFAQSMTDATLEPLRSCVPMLVWVECSNYSSAKTAMERLIPYLPSGCMLQLAGCERSSHPDAPGGASRLVHEINLGAFGECLALTADKGLGHDGIYRFMRIGRKRHPAVVR
jgi:hypothetical protein